MPENAFGYVPTPALVAPIEFTMRLADYEALGGYMACVVSAESLRALDHRKTLGPPDESWPMRAGNFAWKDAPR
jgi:6-hydroxynicotinate reductase